MERGTYYSTPKGGNIGVTIIRTLYQQQSQWIIVSIFHIGEGH